MIAAVHRHVDLAAVAQGGRGTDGIESGNRLGNLGHVLAKAGAQRAVVGLELEAAELVGVVGVTHRAHVQLFTDHSVEAADGLALVARGHHHCLA